MASSLTSTSPQAPHQVGSIEEAQVLIDEAYTQEIFCRRIKEHSETRAKEAIAEACRAYKALLDAEMHTGKVFYLVKASGFQAQNPKPAHPPVVVQICGGADESLSQTNSRSNYFNSTSLRVYPRGWNHGSHPGLSSLTVLLYPFKLNIHFLLTK